MIINDYFNQQSKRLYYKAVEKSAVLEWSQFFKDNDRLHFVGLESAEGKELAMAERWIRRQLIRYERNGLGMLAVRHKESNKLIGLGGIVRRLVQGEREYEIAYSVIPQYWGNGYATEIATTMKHYGKAHIQTKRFVSRIATNNIASAKVALKNGMRLLRSTTIDGMAVDIYGIENFVPHRPVRS